MNRDRVLTLGIIGAIAVVVVLGWVVGVSPILGQVAAANEERASVASINDTNVTKLAAIKKQFENIGDTQAKLDALRGSIPADADMAEFLRTIKTYGDAQGIQLTSVEVSGVSAYVAPAVETPVPAAPASASPTPSPSATPSGTTAPAVTPAAPTSGLLVIPIKISVTGTYDQVMAFSGAMQSGPRLFLVSTLAVSSAAGVFTGDLSGNVYALPSPLSAVVSAVK
jgi:Tfp pilus assembly protein PilO